MATRSAATVPAWRGRRGSKRAPERGGRLLATLVVVATLLAATALGVLVVLQPRLALLGLVGAVLLPVGLWSVPALLGVWIVIVYLGGLPGLESFPNRFLNVVLACGLVAVSARLPRRGAVVPSGRAILPVFLVFLFWQALTMAWTDHVDVAAPQVKAFGYIGVGFLLVLATVRSRRDVRWLAWAFVVGGVVSVLGGVAQGGLTASTTEGDTATTRFTGGAGDANYLAAMLIPSLMLAGGLAVRASHLVRLVLAASALVLAAGLAATQSRGGLIALAVAFLWALVHFRAQRRMILGALTASLAGLAAFFVSYPAAWQRIVAVEDGGNGSGRTDIWEVAWRIMTEHPFIGIGLDQFSLHSPLYVREPGLGGATNLIVNKHIVVHNVYLQTWVETGVIGLALFGTVIGLGLLGARRAAREFEAAGDAEMTALSRAVTVSIVGVLVASFFLSNILARQIWVLLAMGPVLATVAAGARGAPPGASPRGPDDQP